MNNFTQSYEKIFTHLKELAITFPKKTQIRKPRLSDLELIAMNLTAEYSSIGSECQLFRVISGTYLSNKIERSVYNRRRRKLFDYIEQVRQVLSAKFNEFETCFIVDSMPLEICKNSRKNRVKICQENYETSPARGYCASQMAGYFGYKLHAVCSIDGVFKSFDITKENVHDIHYLKDIKGQIFNCILLGDKGYISAEMKLDLFNSATIKLEVPMRKNQLSAVPYPRIFKRVRKRIETLFSQLCDQFAIRCNYAKSFEGFKTRILSKITALTMIQYLNKFVFERQINKIKLNLS